MDKAVKNNTPHSEITKIAQPRRAQRKALTMAPDKCVNDRRLTEQLGRYEKSMRIINGHAFIFVVEGVTQGYCHACSVDDVAYMLEQTPQTDYGDMGLIVFRQPKKQEQALPPAWARLVYSYAFEGRGYPAILLEAFHQTGSLSWKKKMSSRSAKEFERLREDGHLFVEGKDVYKTKLLPEHVRATQLYRSLLHEFGHYVQYLNVVHSPVMVDETLDTLQKRSLFYRKSISHEEKEKFAHSYADTLRAELQRQGAIPFERKSASKARAR